MRFLGDANALPAKVRDGKAYVQDVEFDAAGLADGSAEVLFAALTRRLAGGRPRRSAQVVPAYWTGRIRAACTSAKTTGSPDRSNSTPRQEFRIARGEAGFIIDIHQAAGRMRAAGTKRREPCRRVARLPDQLPWRPRCPGRPGPFIAATRGGPCRSIGRRHRQAEGEPFFFSA